MSAYRPILVRILVRTLLALPFFGLGLYLLFTANSGWASAGLLLIGMALVLLGVIMVAPSLAALLAQPWSSLFYPEETLERPPPVYSIPEGLVKRGEYDAALEYYESIVEAYPDELQAYLEILDLLLVHMHRPERAEAMYQRGMAALHAGKHRDTLARLYPAICSRLDPAKPWEARRTIRLPGQD